MPVAVRGIVLGLAFLGISISQAAGAPTPASAFGNLPQVSNAVLSPDGQELAWLDGSSGQVRLNIYDIAAKKPPRAIAMDPAFRFAWLDWGDDGTLLYSLNQLQKWYGHSGGSSHPQDKMEVSRVFAFGPEDKSGRMMLAGDPDLESVNRLNVVRAHVSKPHTIVTSTLNYSRMAVRQQVGSNIDSGRQASGWVSVAYQVDTHTGKGERIALGDQDTDEWVVNAEGEVVARGQWSPSNKNCEILAKRGLSWDSILKAPCEHALRLQGVSADQHSILMIDRDADGRAKLWAVPLDGSKRSIVLEDAAGDVIQIAKDPYTDAPIEAWIGGVTPRHLWLDKDAERRQQMLEHSFSQRLVRVETASQDKKVIVVRVSGPSNPAMHYLIDLTTHHADILGVDYPGLANVKLGPVTTMHYQAHDGANIEAYLTLPPDTGDGALPLVVLPHGGPASRDSSDDFEELRQFLATRGYAVFQPQFRGSSGFGDSFERAGYHQWGLLMQDDLTDGVHALIDKGRVDPQRICIVGYSYGWGYAGYAALAGAAFTPSLYKCAISVNGVSDLPKFLGYLSDKWGKEHDVVAYARERIGIWSDPAVVAKSPAQAAAAMTAAVLLIDSVSDPEVPANQSKLMADALRSAGKNVQLIELPGEDHALSGAAQVRAFEEIDKFLHDHL